MVSVGILGASGYLGLELLRLCAGHPDFEVHYASADTQAGGLARALYPSLAAAYPDLTFGTLDPNDAGALAGLDLVFAALPHGASQQLVPSLEGKVGHVVDLAADFRLRDAALYPEWYGAPHACPQLLGQAAFGLPELFRAELRGASLIAAAGCYVTAASLALAPLVRSGAVETDGIVIDAASGVSGAGRTLKHSSHFGTANEDFVAYGVLTHRHTPEIEQTIGARVLFTPHLAPMTRGILATCYARPTAAGPSTTDEALRVLREAYAGEPFVVVGEDPPSTKATWGANVVHLTARVDPRTGWLMAMAALDNLVKGGSGQAVQCANLAVGLPETTGLPLVGVYP